MGDIARNWINGDWVESDRVSESIEPATGRVLGRFADGGEAEARAGVAAARAAFEEPSWARDRQLRARVLTEMGELFDAHAAELAALISRENGKLVAEAEFESQSAGRTLRHAAAQVMTETGITQEVAPGTWFSTVAEPAGVVAIIVPWNAPLALLIRSLAPALAAGNAVVVKMPGQTALVANLAAQVIARTRSLPRGVVNLFTESGNSGAPFLVASPEVQVVSYTGSVTVGRKIAEVAATSLKRVNLELGGKTPMIVFDDADLDRVVPLLSRAVTTFGGQFCMTGSRVLVQRGVAEAVRDRLAELLSRVRPGHGMAPDSDMGPVIDMAALRRIDAMVEAALAYATPIVRGGPDPDPTLAGGAFYRPTLLEVTDTDTPIVQEEVFGPVATFEVFTDEAEAITRANATELGLAAGVFTRDGDRSRRVSRAIQAGTVWTNTWAALDDSFPEGGYKQSGVGRLRGALALTEFQEPKTYVHLVASP
jgi:acyl-CoA reductase-like NAD-dependent aldehyde dehydrogenase